MKAFALDFLRCPRCGGALALASQTVQRDEIIAGTLSCQPCRTSFDIVDGIARFAPRSNYTTNFGMQWKKFRQTQLDSYTGLPISQTRFYAQSGWTPAVLAGKRVLDAGCGAGRFTEVALAAGAEVMAVDFSEAVDACYLNHSANPQFNVVQADILKLPFKRKSFDYVFCFGVLQHTPDPRAAFLALPEQLKPGG